MKNDPLATGLRGLLHAENEDFATLVRRAGLSPTKDFRFADLSEADLREQDLTAFDFSGARFCNAMISGAIFNGSASDEQLALAIDDDPEARRRLGGGDRLKKVMPRSDITPIDPPRPEPRRPTYYSGSVSNLGVVDLGASKASCLMMSADGVDRDRRTITTASVGYIRSRGIRGGGIINLDEATQTIAHAAERAETFAGMSLQGVYVCTAGGELASQRMLSQVSLNERPVSDGDLSRAIASALAKVSLPGRKPIHLLPVTWVLDGRRGVRDPRGMFGQTLGLELLVVSVDESIFRTVAHCVERAHLSFRGLIASPFASALGALEEDEMDLGAACIDMGGGSTSIAVFDSGSLTYVDSVSIGGGQITQDIARALQTTIAGAEHIKTLYGSSVATADDEREMIEAPRRSDEPGLGAMTVPRSLLRGVIQFRVEETFELLRDRLSASGNQLDPAAGIVLTGGASQLAGVRELAVRVFDRPVRIGRPMRALNLPDTASGPAFCAAVGALHRIAFGPREAVTSKALSSAPTRSRTINPNASPMTKAAAWLRDNF